MNQCSPDDVAKDSPHKEQGPRRIGVYGGSFDPIHNTHLEIARTALLEGPLDFVLFVVASLPPHKREGTAARAEDRLALVEAAIASEPCMTASRLELDREGPSYTIDTLQTLTGTYPQAELFLILGMDSLIDLPKWRDPDGILALADILVVPRPGSWRVPAKLEGHYKRLSFEETILSSTDIRKRFEVGETVSDVLPPEVERIIRERGMYGAAS